MKLNAQDCYLPLYIITDVEIAWNTATNVARVSHIDYYLSSTKLRRFNNGHEICVGECLCRIKKVKRYVGDLLFDRLNRTKNKRRYSN